MRPPAAVIAGVQIGHLYPETKPARPVDGIIDTGAARSAVPIDVCNDFYSKPHDYGTVYGADRQHGVQRPRYWMKIAVTDLAAVHLLVYGLPRSTVLLGRDFLEKLNLACLIDWKQHRWWISAKLDDIIDECRSQQP